MKWTQSAIQAQRVLLQGIVRRTDHNLYPLGVHQDLPLNIHIPKPVHFPQPKFTIPDEQTVLRCKKVRVKFTDEQFNLVSKWFEIYRLTYNETLKELKNRNFNEEDIPTKNNMRNRIVSLVKEKYKDQLFEIPSHILEEAVFDVYKARKTAFANLKAKNINHFRMRYKKKCDTICIPSQGFSKKKNTIYIGSLGNFVNTGEFSIKGLNKACRLSWKKDGFVLFVPQDTPIIRSNFREKICALDPGVRVFQTLYDKEIVSNIGDDLANKIAPLIIKINMNLNKKLNERLRARIKNIVDDTHNKICQTLTTSYGTVMIGNMSTQNVLGSNKLPKLTKQILQAMSHFTFRQKLINKGKINGCEVKIIDEAYTSKTCSYCGFIKDNLGADAFFHCDECGRFMGRDASAARNIFIKGVTLGK